MKIGLSYSRCVRDIIDGEVDIDDVLVIIARTNFDPNDDDQWKGIWNGYRGSSIMSNPEWAMYSDEDEERFRAVSIDLWQQGKFHQPRQFDAYPKRMPYIWLEAVLPSEELDKNPSLKKAWDNFQVMAGLSGVELDKRAQ